MHKNITLNIKCLLGKEKNEAQNPSPSPPFIEMRRRTNRFWSGGVVEGITLDLRWRLWPSKEILNLCGELTLFSLDVSQVFNFFLQIGLTLIFATLEDLDLGLLGDVISEDDCGDDGEDENVFIIGERCNLGWMNIVKITSPRDV
ncbi:hypothetical protein Tco_1017134 [Tanacetum coccineum]|uniref:Uncharacterized protein n=1 Tax=Tanacetum coccineum TaxID=301880 RepID=A0ABQ5FR54_9ASTR